MHIVCVRESRTKRNTQYITGRKFYGDVDREPLVKDRGYSLVHLKTDRTRRNLNNGVI